MRETTYRWLIHLPFKVSAGTGWFAGLLSAAIPSKLEKLVGAKLSADTIQAAGIALLALSSVYFALLWCLKPSNRPTPHGAFSVTGGIHIYQGIAEKLKEAEAKPPPHSAIKPDDPGMGHTANPATGILKAQEQGADVFSATGTVGLKGLYVGNIIVAAGALRNEHFLEIAVRGFNGSCERLIIGEMMGSIRAGVDNLRDYVELNALAIKETVRTEPYSEFLLVLYQHVSPELAQKFLIAFEDRHVGLDLRHLTIKAACRDNIERWARLPLWDGVLLRRRDDIVSNRNTILGAASGHIALTGKAEGKTQT